MEYAPVVVFVYDRIEHFSKCIEAIKANKEASETILYVVSDAAGCVEHEEKIEKVREYSRSITGFKEVRFVFREENFGAFLSLQNGKAYVVKNHGRLIYMEDDIIVSDRFLEYMNMGLEVYKDRKDIFSICGCCRDFITIPYDKDVLLLPMMKPWGMATWKDRWIDAEEHIFNPVSREDMKDRELVGKIRKYNKTFLSYLREDMDERVKLFDARINLYVLKKNMYSVFPRRTLARTIGDDGSGLHMDTRGKYSKVKLWEKNGDFEMDEDIVVYDDIIELSNKAHNGRYRAVLKDLLYKIGLMYFSVDVRRKYKMKMLKRSGYKH
jgi:hypothetical protein